MTSIPSSKGQSPRPAAKPRYPESSPPRAPSTSPSTPCLRRACSEGPAREGAGQLPRGAQHPPRGGPRPASRPRRRPLRQTEGRGRWRPRALWGRPARQTGTRRAPLRRDRAPGLRRQRGRAPRDDGRRNPRPLAGGSGSRARRPSPRRTHGLHERPGPPAARRGRPSVRPLRAPRPPLSVRVPPARCDGPSPRPVRGGRSGQGRPGPVGRRGVGARVRRTGRVSGDPGPGASSRAPSRSRHLLPTGPPDPAPGRRLRRLRRLRRRLPPFVPEEGTRILGAARRPRARPGVPGPAARTGRTASRNLSGRR